MREGGREMKQEFLCVGGEAFLMGSLCYDFPCRVRYGLQVSGAL